MLRLVTLLLLLLSGTLAMEMHDNSSMSSSNSSMSSSNSSMSSSADVKDEWKKACIYGTATDCTDLPLQFGSRGLKISIDTNNTSDSFVIAFTSSTGYIGSSGWSKDGAYIEGCGIKSFENISMSTISGVWDFYIKENIMSIWLNDTRVLSYQFEDCADKFRDQTLVPMFSNFPESSYWRYSKGDESGEQWADVVNSEDAPTTILLSDFKTRGASFYINTDNSSAVRTIIVFNQTDYIGYVGFNKEGGFLDGCGFMKFSSGNVGSNITGLWSSYITSKKIILQFNNVAVIDYDFEECGSQWIDQDISGIMFMGFNDNGNKDYYKYAKDGSDADEMNEDKGSGKTDDYEDDGYDRTCPDGQGEMEMEENKMCKDCNRGEFGWKGKCTPCPPGKSTVNEGSKYEDCIDNRYIMCDLNDWGYSCRRDYCPCNWGWEECREGLCYTMQTSLAQSQCVTTTGFIILVSAIITLAT